MPRKRVGQQGYPIQLCGSPLDIMYTMEVWGVPLIPDAEKHTLRPFHSINSKIGM